MFQKNKKNKDDHTEQIKYIQIYINVIELLNRHFN